MPNEKNPPPYCRDCSAKAIKGYRCCAVHLEKNRNKMKRRYDERREAGICTYPGCGAIAIGYCCPKHRKDVNARTKKYRAGKRKGVVRGKRL